MKYSLNVKLRKNLLTKDPDDYTAFVQYLQSVGLEDIINELILEGMEIKRETAIDVVSRFNRKASELVVAGHKVNTGLVYMRPVVTGNFNSKLWNPYTDKVYIAINQGLSLREAVADTTVTVQSGLLEGVIEINLVTDSTTGLTDGTLTKGRNAEIKGTNIRIMGNDPECGITFRNVDTDTVTKLDATDIVQNDPSYVLILVPATLVAGNYELTVTTQFSNGNYEIKQPRSVTYGTTIVIA